MHRAAHAPRQPHQDLSGASANALGPTMKAMKRIEPTPEPKELAERALSTPERCEGSSKAGVEGHALLQRLPCEDQHHAHEQECEDPKVEMPRTLLGLAPNTAPGRYQEACTVSTRTGNWPKTSSSAFKRPC